MLLMILHCWKLLTRYIHISLFTLTQLLDALSLNSVHKRPLLQEITTILRDLRGIQKRLEGMKDVFSSLERSFELLCFWTVFIRYF